MYLPFYLQALTWQQEWSSGTGGVRQRGEISPCCLVALARSQRDIQLQRVIQDGRETHARTQRPWWKPASVIEAVCAFSKLVLQRWRCAGSTYTIDPDGTYSMASPSQPSGQHTELQWRKMCIFRGTMTEKIRGKSKRNIHLVFFLWDEWYYRWWIYLPFARHWSVEAPLA